jgi:hypothetical protein
MTAAWTVATVGSVCVPVQGADRHMNDGKMAQEYVSGVFRLRPTNGSASDLFLYQSRRDGSKPAQGGAT